MRAPRLPTTIAMRRGALVHFGRVALLLAVGLAVLIGWAAPASAHATLLATVPQAGYSTAAPARLQLTFDEPVSISGNALSLHRSSGGPIRLGHATLDRAGRQVSAVVLGRLAPARYTVGWQVTAADGEVIAGSFEFAVGSPGRSNSVLSGTVTPRQNTEGLAPLIGLRWLLFAGLALALGGGYADVLLTWRARRFKPDAAQASDHAPVASSPTIGSARAQVLVGTLVGLAGAVGLSVLLAGGGSVAAGLRSLGRLPGEHAGRIVLAEVVGFAGAAAATRWTDGWSGAGAGLAVVVAAEAVRNHVGNYAGAAGVLLIGIHLAAAAVWLGALVHVARVASRQRTDHWVQGAFGNYLRLALPLYVVVVVTGTVCAVIVVGSSSALLHTGYGHILLVKVALVAVASGLALSGRLRLRRPGGRAPGLLVRAERAVLLAVLAGSAALVSAAPPRPVSAASALPPPPVVGPAVRLGWLLGQVSTQVVVSRGRVELRFTTPDAGGGEPVYRADAHLSSAGPRARRVHLVRCGAGCFTGVVSWPSGVGSLSVAVSATGWHGGRHVFDVAWPPQADSSILPRVVARMRAQRSVLLREADTSDTSRPPRPADRLTTSGPQFISAEPYGDGTGIAGVVAVDLPGRRRELRFALPAEEIAVDMIVGPSRLIEHEVIAAPEHLLTRDFTYPPAAP